jgi:hypothetical protein
MCDFRFYVNKLMFFLHHVFFSVFVCQQVKIVISMDGVLVLIHVVIANFIQLDLVLCVVLFCEVGATIMGSC